MIKVILSGLGNTGIEILKCIKETEGVDLSCGVSEFNLKDKSYKVYRKFKDIKEKADVIIDFSKPSRIDEILDYAINNEIPIVIGTTGYTEEQNEKILKASKLIPVFKSSNTSIGITVMLRLINIATKLLDGFDIEVIEKHHNRKTDCPCGTAYMTADVIKEVRHELENIYGRKDRDCSRQKMNLESIL